MRIVEHSYEMLCMVLSAVRAFFLYNEYRNTTTAGMQQIQQKRHSNECRYQWSKQYHTKRMSKYAKARAMEQRYCERTNYVYLNTNKTL